MSSAIKNYFTLLQDKEADEQAIVQAIMALSDAECEHILSLILFETPDGSIYANFSQTIH